MNPVYNKKEKEMGQMRCVSMVVLGWLLACAAGPVWGQYGGGTGTAGNPWLIGTAGHLQYLADTPGDWDKAFELTADLDLTGVAISAIGHDSHSFAGVFDGAGHTLANFTVKAKRTDHVGLFGVVDGPDAEIRDLKLVNAKVTGRDHVGALAGLVIAADISGCFVEGGSISGNAYVGALAGSAYGDSTISSNAATATIRGYNSVGGLVGSNNGTISYSGATGAVKGKTSSASGGYFHFHLPAGVDVGGLVGSSTGAINTCYATGKVTGLFSIGGLVGSNSGTIDNSTATGKASGWVGVGGLVGEHLDGAISNCYATGVAYRSRSGGLVGTNYGTISNSYANGAAGAGGLVGYGGDGGSVVGSFWDTKTSRRKFSDGGTGRKTEQMQTAGTFTDAGWDFVGESQNGVEEIWAIRQGWCSPYLAWQGSCNPDDDLPADVGLCVSKSKIKAGRSRGLDSFAFSGTMGVWQANFARASTITVSLARCTDDMIVFAETIGIEAEQLKRGKFRYKGSRGGLTKLRIDVNRHIFSVSGSHIDLGGLSSPMVLEIKIGDCPDRDRVSEAVINGRRPIPMQLLNGYDDALRVDRYSVKIRTRTGRDSLAIRGAIAVADMSADMSQETVQIHWGDFTATLPAADLSPKSRRGIYKYRTTSSSSGPVGKAIFDLQKGKFKIAIKNADIGEQESPIQFGISFGSFAESVDL